MRPSRAGSGRLSNRCSPSPLTFTFLLSFLTAATLFAAVPAKVNLVGRLDAVPNGAADGAPSSRKVMYMVFRVYAEPGRGRDADKAAVLWGRQAVVALNDGLFDVDLEDALGTKVSGAKYDALADAVDDVLARGTSVLYVGITPENDANAEIFPRLRVTAVPKAVQAAFVRTVPGDFEVGKGVFGAEELVVEKSATLGQASYGSVTFGPKGEISFDGGLAVSTVTAGNVEVSGTLRAPTVVAETLRPQVPVSVDGPVAVAGSPTVDGDLGTSKDFGPTVAVSTVSAPISGKVGPAGRLVLEAGLKNLSGQGFDSATGGVWNVLGEWTEIADLSGLQSEASGNESLRCYDEFANTMRDRTAVTEGLWSAPCDCIAYFQVHLSNHSADYGACVQFYLVESAKVTDFYSRTPNAVVSLRNGDGATLDSTVAMVLNKNQLVKWFGVNKNENTSTGIIQTSDSCVRKITYRAFNW